MFGYASNETEAFPDLVGSFMPSRCTGPASNYGMYDVLRMDNCMGSARFKEPGDNRVW